MSGIRFKYKYYVFKVTMDNLCSSDFSSFWWTGFTFQYHS